MKSHDRKERNRDSDGNRRGEEKESADDMFPDIQELDEWKE